MAIDLEKIKQKVAQLSGQGRKTNLWWPEVGKDYAVRLLPWPDGNDGQPFKERAFYYNIGGAKSILAPVQFNKPDPIQSLITKLRNEGTPASLELAKNFYPKKKYFAPVIIRGEEDQGPKLWSLNKETVSEILNFILGEAGDITDVREGRDVVIKCIPSGKKFNGRDVAKINMQPKMTQTPTGTAKQVKEWTAAIPNLDEIYTQMSADDIEKRVNDHLNGGTMASSDGTEKKPFVKKGTEVTAEESTELDDVFSKLDGIADADA